MQVTGLHRELGGARDPRRQPAGKGCGAVPVLFAEMCACPVAAVWAVLVSPAPSEAVSPAGDGRPEHAIHLCLTVPSGSPGQCSWDAESWIDAD